MRKIYVIDVEVSLNVEQVVTETSFNNLAQTFRGEGFNIEEAKRNAISKIDVSSYVFSNFIKNTKARIVDYYQKNTSTIITKSKSLAVMKQYSAALALLTTYPETLSGYEMVSNTAIMIFKQWQDQNCSQLLQQAKGEYTLGNIEKAISLLTQIDTSSQCIAEATNMISSIKSSLDKEKSEAIAQKEKEILSENEITKQKINAMKEIAKSYFESNLSYDYIYE